MPTKQFICASTACNMRLSAVPAAKDAAHQLFVGLQHQEQFVHHHANTGPERFWCGIDCTLLVGLPSADGACDIGPARRYGSAAARWFSAARVFLITICYRWRRLSGLVHRYNMISFILRNVGGQCACVLRQRREPRFLKKFELLLPFFF